MPQINIHVTPPFERALSRFMRLRSIGSKSEAIRLAVQEAYERARVHANGVSFGDLLGAARPEPGAARITDDMLWEDGDLGD